MFFFQGHFRMVGSHLSRSVQGSPASSPSLLLFKMAFSPPNFAATSGSQLCGGIAQPGTETLEQHVTVLQLLPDNQKFDLSGWEKGAVSPGWSHGLGDGACMSRGNLSHHAGQHT